MKDIFFLYLEYPATGPGFVLQLFPSLCFFVFVAYGTHSRAYSCPFLGSLLFVYPCAGLSGADSVNLLLRSQTGATLLTAVFFTGSTWHLTASPQACCWWRKCHGTRWARSTRRTYCNISSHNWAVFI